MRAVAVFYAVGKRARTGLVCDAQVHAYFGHEVTPSGLSGTGHCVFGSLLEGKCEDMSLLI